MEDKVQMFNMLQTVVTHFSENPEELRSIDKKSRECLYYPPLSEKPKSIGCAIGMFVNWKNAEKLDIEINGYNTGIIRVLNSKKSCLLPKWMREMNSDFLQGIQSLHDSNENWNSDNISSDGKQKVESICKSHGLDYSKIKFKK